MVINVDPSSLQVPINGQLTMKLHNVNTKKLVYCVSMVPNDIYKIEPAYGFLEPQGKTEVRISSTKQDPDKTKFYIFASEPIPDKSEASEAFNDKEEVRTFHLETYAKTIQIEADAITMCKTMTPI